MKRSRNLITICALLIGALACVSQVAAAPKMVRIHSQMPVGHYNGKAIDIFIDEASKLTKGEFKFMHYPAQQLYRDEEIPDILPKGGVEMAQINGSMFIGKVVEAGLGALPATFDDLDHFYRYYLNSPAMQIMDEAFQKKANVYILNSLLYSPNNAVLCTKPIEQISDFKGKKIRGWGKTLAVVLEAWGASGVVLSSSDVYMGMERGTIDGVMSGLTSFYSRKWYEPAKHVNVINGFLPAPFNLAANLDFWKSLSPEQQGAFLQAAQKAEVFCTKAAIEDWDKAQQALEAKGVKIYTWPADQAKLLREMARPACMNTLVKEPLGEEMVGKVNSWVEESRRTNMTWEQASQAAMKSRMDALQKK